MAYRYRTTLRPASQLNLQRLGYLEGTDLPPTRDRYDHGSFATSRQLTEFECSHLDLEYLGEDKLPFVANNVATYNGYPIDGRSNVRPDGS